MKAHPILFSGEMVRAILAGRKTQTRRVVKAMPGKQAQWLTPSLLNAVRFVSVEEWGDIGLGVALVHPKGGPLGWIRCPYGAPGDRLWVRETWQAVSPDEDWRPLEECNIFYRATDEHPGLYDPRTDEPSYVWRPSIHMPRWASRLTLEVTGVRVERVRDISNEDAFAEGCTAYPDRGYWQQDPMGSVVLADTPRDEFQMLWNAINAKRGYGWDVNPWVWVVEFRRAEA